MLPDLSKKPRDNDAHTWADYAEMACWFNPDGLLSRADLPNHFDLSSADTDSDDIEASREDESGTKADHFSTRVESQLADCFDQLAWRCSSFGGSYPFSLSADGRVLARVVTANEIQRLYMLLLFCANLPYLPQKGRQSYTDAFERISLLSLSRLFPLPWRTIPFAKNQSGFTGSKSERLNLLFDEMGGTANYQDSTFRSGDSGDGGIDLAGFRPLDMHEKGNIPSWLAQCACSRKDWSRKQGAVIRQAFGKKVAIAPDWLPIISIPHCFRDNTGKWAVDSEVTIMALDRLRLMELLKEQSPDWNQISVPADFHLVLEQREGIV